jgi:hypothetical protein
MNHLGLRYLHGHPIATRAEQAAVRAAGISWDAYDRFGQATLFKTAHNRIFSRVDLDPA